MANKTFKLFADKMGGRQAGDYIGNEGEIFYDPTGTSLRISDGVTAGGQSLSAGGGGDTGDITFNGVEIRGIPAEMKSGLIKLVPTPDTEGYSFLDYGQFVQIYPTNIYDAPHIHIAAGIGEEGEGDIFLGDDAKYVQVSANGQVSIQTFDYDDEEAHQWIFNAQNSSMVIPGDIYGTSSIDINTAELGGSGSDINLYAADDITIQAGSKLAGADSEGGDINITGGNGSDADGFEVGNSGGDLTITSGSGGNASFDNVAGQAGNIDISCGAGGGARADGNKQAGAGSNINITAGAAGNNDGNTALGNYGGAVILTAGNATDNQGGGAIIFNSGVDDAGTPGDYSFGNLREKPLTYKEAIAALAFTPVTLATLGTAASAGAGARAFITNSNAVASGNFGAVAASGGSNVVPVYSDGTNWRIG
jgi:hypothetical protein